jgi:hypothetical protein
MAHVNGTDELTTASDPHLVFRCIGGCGETGPKGQCDAESSEYLVEKMPYFQPQHGTGTNLGGSLYLVDSDLQKCIPRRLGRRDVLAEYHLDGSP